jgi:hypothetical protein
MWIDDPSDDPIEFITSAAAAPMRRDARFMALAERTGLLAYWRSGRPPDFCRDHPEPVCTFILKRNWGLDQERGRRPPVDAHATRGQASDRNG